MTKLQPFKVRSSMSEDQMNAAISAVPNSDLQDVARYIGLMDNIEIVDIDGSTLTNRVLNTCGIIIEFRGKSRSNDDYVLTSDDISNIVDKIQGGNTYIDGFEATIHAAGSNFILVLKADSNQTR